LPDDETAASSGPSVGTASTVRVLFPDLHGVARGKDIPVREFDRVAEHGIGFCSAVMGTDLRNTPVVGGDEGYPDMRAVPDMSTLLPVPWEPGVSAVIADLMGVGEEQPEPLDPRGALRRAVKELEALGYRPIVGPELEFYLCSSDGGDPPRFSRHLDRASMIYTVGAQADPDGFVRKLTESLSEFGLEAFAASHEFSNSQYEINLREAAALTAADRAFLLKTAVKEVAGQNGLLATFMGKPFNDQGGSGFHLHVSLDRDGANAFTDPDGRDGVSDPMRAFLAGVLHHAPALMALLNPTVNAYRRIVPGSLAPTHANWGWDNRMAMVRVPPDRGDATRLEVRMGDGSANAYLAVAGVLFAGLHGLRESLPLQPPVAGAVTADTRDQPLAHSLEASLAALERDSVLRGLFAPKLVDTFVAVKRFELERHRAWVSDWEVEEYLRHL
jgi:glutamine synthetase